MSNFRKHKKQSRLLNDAYTTDTTYSLAVPPPPLPQAESQTQNETQFIPPFIPATSTANNLDGDLKRKATTSDQNNAKASKKIKISVGPAVDLGD